MTRPENVARAQELRAEGKLLREIAAEMGVAISTVDAWLNDPDGSRLRARQDSYRGTCEDCDAPTNGSNGRAAAPRRCTRCQRQYEHENRRWTREAVIDAIRAFAAERGRPPRAGDFCERRPRGDRFPNVTTVQREFGTWNAAVVAAGFEPFSESRDHTWGPGRPIHVEAEEAVAA